MSVSVRACAGNPGRPGPRATECLAVGDIVTVRYRNSVRYRGVIDAIGAQAFLYHVTAVDGRAPSGWVFRRDIEGRVDVTRPGPGDRLIGSLPSMARGCP